MDLVLSTYLNPSGLSAIGQGYFKFFSEIGIRVVPVWLAPPETLHLLSSEVVAEMIAAAGRPIGEAVHFHAGLAGDVRLAKDRTAALASIVVEGNRLTEEQITACRGLDVVLVPSFFCRNAIVSSGIPKSKTFYCPYFLDSSAWHQSVLPSRPDNGRFRFLYMNTIYERKGWDLLLRAWWEEFSADDGVELVVKSYRENDRSDPLDIMIATAAARLGVNMRKRAPVIAIDEVMSSIEMPSFMKGFDAYVSPHRSEGFGLNIWHAMALGVPVICTDYGGNTDFCKEDTSWPVKISKMVRPSEKERNIFGQYNNIVWAEPDIFHLRRQMRDCMSNRIEAAKRAEHGAKHVAKSYSGAVLLDHLEDAMTKVVPEIWAKLCSERAIDQIVRQPMPRFETTDKPLRMVEV